jgi:hypothetical protein
VIRAPCIAGARRPRSSTRSAATGDGDPRLVPQPVLRAACGPKSVGISQLGGVGLEPSVGQRRGLADRGVSGRVLWAALSHPDRVADELASWARARGLESSGAAATVPELSARLRVGLRDKRMLLLLDDVWEVAHAEPFRPGSQGSSPQRWTRMRSHRQRRREGLWPLRYVGDSSLTSRDSSGSASSRPSVSAPPEHRS